MKYYVGTAYDTNPARLEILMKRNKKTTHRRRIHPSLLSTFFMGFAWASKILR